MTRVLTALFIAAGVAAAQIPLPYPIFDKDEVQVIRLTFENADWFQVLTDNYSGVRADNPYFPASIEWGEKKFENIGVRFKGNSTYSASRGNKKPFRIKLNEFVKGQKIDGIGSFSLSNGWNDPSFVREKVYYEMAAVLGMRAPRSSFAALYINGEYWGLYILTEVVNSDFLKNYFGKDEDTGNMYKGNIGATFAYLGEDPAAYKTAWEKQSNEDADDWTDLVALCKLIAETPLEERREKFDAVMDVDSILAALALDNATVNLDSYVGMGQNFNIYRRPSDGRWVWIPWDPSLAFGALSQGQDIAGMKKLALEWVNSGGGFGGGGPGGGAPPGGGAQAAGRPLATKLWEVPEYKERYRQIYRQLVEKSYSVEKVVARMNQLREMIRPWVEMDQQKLVTQEDFDNAMTADSAGSGPGGGGAPGGPGGPAPGGPPPGLPGGPGGQGGGRANGGIPGLEPFITERVAFVTEQLEAEPVSVAAITADVIAISLEAQGKESTSKVVTLNANGTSTLGFYSLRTSTETGGDWLRVTPAGGELGKTFKVTVGGSPAAGTYKGMIHVFWPAAIHGPLEIPVVLTVTE